jgi:hypothetical protein
MAKEQSTVYQSGQKVPVTGTYIVASTEPNAVMNQEDDKGVTKDLKEGELFPDYNGRAVTWHLQDKHHNTGSDAKLGTA